MMIWLLYVIIVCFSEVFFVFIVYMLVLLFIV